MGTKTATAIASTTSETNSLFRKIKISTMGKVTADTIEDNDTNRERMSVIVKIIIAINEASGYNAIPTPSKVAIPLPPLKPT
jgi:uncharacterized protein YqfB (UPF0267 family)